MHGRILGSFSDKKTRRIILSEQDACSIFQRKPLKGVRDRGTVYLLASIYGVSIKKAWPPARRERQQAPTVNAPRPWTAYINRFRARGGDVPLPRGTSALELMASGSVSACCCAGCDAIGDLRRPLPRRLALLVKPLVDATSLNVLLGDILAPVVERF